MREPVFLDRDGVINENGPDYVRTLSMWMPIPGSLEAAAALSAAGQPVVVVTNQSAIGRGLVDKSTVDSINALMSGRIEAAGGRLSGVYVCPHRPDEGCTCRKPETGMIEAARRDLGLPPGGWLVGDAETDMEMGRRAGLETVLVMTGRGLEQAGLARPGNKPDHVAADLAEAAAIILGADAPDEGGPS